MPLTLPRRALVDPDELPSLPLRASVPQPFAPTSAEPDALDGFELGREWLRKLNWGLFETLVETAFARDGFLVLPAPARLAGRADMVLERRSERLLVQCKHWKAWQVGTPTVRELQDLVSQDAASGGIVITAGKYSAEAHVFAAEVGLILLDGDDLLRMAVGAPVLPLAEETATQWRAPKAWTAFGAPTCPVCDAPMLYKRVRMGAHAGTRFWGCPGFPSCRAVREAGPGNALPMERPVDGSEPAAVEEPVRIPSPPAEIPPSPGSDLVTAAVTDEPAAAPSPIVAQPLVEVEADPEPPEPQDPSASPLLNAAVQPALTELTGEPRDSAERLMALLAPETPYAEAAPPEIQPAPLRAPVFRGASAPLAPWPADTFRSVPPQAKSQSLEPRVVQPKQLPAQPAAKPEAQDGAGMAAEGGHRRSTMVLMAVIGICAAAAVAIAAVVPAVLHTIQILTR